ncbi:MAG: cellulase family glycosylhydrolase, partial [Elusimicrobiota bacterium]
MASTLAALSSALAAAASFKDGDIIYSHDFENSTPTNNITFTGTTVQPNYVSVLGPNSMTSTCMVIPNVVAKGGSGAYAAFSFPSADIPAISPSYIEISGWVSAINVATATVNGGLRLVVKSNNVNIDMDNFTPNTSNAVPWQKFVRLVPIPKKGVTSIVLNLGFWEAGGAAWFDNIKIRLVKKIPTDSNGNYAGAYQQYYTGHPGNPVVSNASQAATFFRGMHYSDTFFRSQTAQEGLEVLGGKWNANILRWMLEGPIGSSNIDNLYTLNYDNGPVTYTSPKGIVTTYNNGTYWNVLDDALVRLDEALKYASQYGLKVVVNLAGLSGGLFESKANQDKFVQVWQYVANRYKNSPYSNAIYGYDLANEPFIDGGWQQWTGAGGVLVWDDLAEKTAKAINAIDMTKTIIVEPWKRGPSGFNFQVPINASNVVYSVHMYQPNPFTGQTAITGNAGSFDWPYPNYNMAGDLAAVSKFQNDYNAHIYVGEFSATRWAGFTTAMPPAEKTAAYNYIKDCINIFEANNWDWTYFGYRADGWSSEYDDNIGTYNAGFYSSSLRSTPNLREQHLRGYFAKNKNPYTQSQVPLPLTSLTIDNIYPYSNWYVKNQLTGSTAVKLKLSGVLPIDGTNNLNGYYLANNNTPPTAASTWYSVAAATFFFDNSITHTLTGGNGSKIVYAWFKSNSGNIYGPVTDTINLDTSLSGKIKPTITITVPTTMPTYRTAVPINLRVIV